MEAYTPTWLDQQLARKPVLPLVVVSLPMGDRFYSVIHPGAGITDVASPLDADVALDADVPWNGGGLALEIAARLISLDGVEDSGVPIETDIVAALGQAQRVAASVDLDNRDGAMSTLVGREYLLNQTADIYLTFPGLGIEDALRKLHCQVVRYALTKRSLRLDLESL